jgi:predicted transcriptional regulator
MSEGRRIRIAELNKELGSLLAEKAKRQLRGKSVDDLEKKQEELEQQKHQLVEEIQDTWSS